jgi:hypothetical protein
MKRIKTLLIMCGVLVILALAYVTIVSLAEKTDDTGTDETDTPMNTSYTAAKIDINTLYIIKYNLGGDKYDFSLNDAGSAWLWEDNTSLPLDSTYFATMATSLKSVTSTVKLTGQESTLAKYGLDVPWLTVTVSDEVNGMQTFMFGSLNSFNNQYYFMTGSETGTVYMVSGSVASSFDYTPYDMVKNDTLPVIEAASIRKLTFRTSSEEWVYTYYENGKDDLAGTADIWYVSKNGGTETVLDDETAEAVSGAVAAIALTDIAGYSDADKKSLGLEEPTVLTISYVAENTVTNESGVSTTVNVDSTLEINLGYADGKGNVYASLPGSVLSYRIDGSIIAGLYNAIISPSNT